MIFSQVIEENKTKVTVIHLLGFQIPHSIKFLVFLLFLILYCLTICGNLLIITLVSYSKTLHSPMYFFIAQLAVSDILLTNDLLPNMLHALLEKNAATISFTNCITQFYFFAVTETSDCLLLTVMSYDRYLAICRPLHYPLLMTSRFCHIAVITSWCLSILAPLTYTVDLSKLQFCGPNVINHFFCDLDPILQLSCSDTSVVQLESTALSIVFAMIPFFVVIVSYIFIIITIFNIPSITGRQKVFSTCSSHLTVVYIFYGTLVCVYLMPSKGHLWNITMFLSLLYTVVTPLLNPIIYSLRNKDLKQAFVKNLQPCLPLTTN